MNWLERAQREIQDNAKTSTANTAVRSPENQESGQTSTANTVIRSLTAVTAVRRPAYLEKCGGPEERSFDLLTELPELPETPETPPSDPIHTTSDIPGPSSPVPGVPWPTSTADWRTCFADRVLAAEITAGLSRPQAEERAYKACLAEWLDRNPASSKADDGCAICGAAARPNDSLLPTGLGSGDGLVWLHRDCVPAWRTARMVEATSALVALGITSKGSST